MWKYDEAYGIGGEKNGLKVGTLEYQCSERLQGSSGSGCIRL